MKEYLQKFRVRVRYDFSIALPYWLFKKGSELHGCNFLDLVPLPNGSLLIEPVDIVWIKAPKRKYKVVIHKNREGKLWAEVPKIPGLRVEGISTKALMRHVRATISTANSNRLANGHGSSEGTMASSLMEGRVDEPDAH